MTLIAMSEPTQTRTEACATRQTGSFNPTPSEVQSELRHVRALMQLEQKEDQAQFKLKNASASIKERRRRGLTWYPVKRSL